MTQIGAFNLGRFTPENFYVQATFKVCDISSVSDFNDL